MNDIPVNRIHEANVELHRIEAGYYELIHGEIYNKIEQKRINSTLKRIDKLISNNNKKALDFGSGTGNLTGKLLHMGYDVTATDISEEMCKVLEKKFKNFVKAKKLKILNSKIEDVGFKREEFSLIACYSVLHHLPDYVDVIRKLSFFLRKGGIMYLDHEASPFFWHKPKSIHVRLIKHIYSRSVLLLLSLNEKIIHWRGIDTPSLDYEMSDFWIKERRHLEHEKIRKVFEGQNFKYFKREDYHLNRVKFFNPFLYIYKYICKPDSSLWIAKK